MNNGTFSLTHIVREPVVKTGAPAPVLILLHGIGSNERDLMGLAPELDGRFFVVSARAPLTRGPGAYAWFQVQFGPPIPVIDPEEAERSRQTLVRFVKEVVEHYPVDPRQVYLMGFSQGCIMSLYASLTEPELFAGVVCMSGRLLPEAEPRIAPRERLQGLPLLVVHGARDEVLPVFHGRNIRDKVGQLPVRLEYREYEIGHWVSPESLADIKRWLGERLAEPPR